MILWLQVCLIFARVSHGTTSHRAAAAALEQPKESGRTQWRLLLVVVELCFGGISIHAAFELAKSDL